MTNNIESYSNPRLRAFIGRSFDEKDLDVWREFREVFDGFKPLGMVYEDGSEGQARAISDKVKEKIERNHIYIGILSCRHPIWEQADSSIFRRFKSFKPKKWATSEWVIEEVGFALGREKTVITLIEEGVVFPFSDLDADTQWIKFSREKISECQTELTQMISNLISDVIPGSITTVDAEVKPIEEEQPDQAAQQPLLSKFFEHLKNKAFFSAEEAEKEFLGSIEDEGERTDLEKMLLGFKAKAGHEESVKQLSNHVSQEPSNKLYLLALVGFHVNFKNYSKAIDLLQKSQEHFQGEELFDVQLKLARMYIEEKQYGDAKKILGQIYIHSTSNETKLQAIQSLENIAKENDDQYTRMGLLEVIIEDNPSDENSRFNLAYLYANSDKDELAVYHYKIVDDMFDSNSAKNNLGSSCGSLGLNAKKVEYLKASELDLAKANLAHIYIDAGVLEEGESLASSVISSEDDQAKARAAQAISNVRETRERESKKIDSIAETTKEERSFWKDYGKGYLATSEVSMEGTFKTSLVDLVVQIKNGQIEALGTRNYNSGLASLMTGAVTPPNLGVSFSASATYKLLGSSENQVGKYKLTITTVYSYSPDKPKTEEIEGCFVLSADQTKIRFLERHDSKTTIYEAIKKDI